MEDDEIRGQKIVLVSFLPAQEQIKTEFNKPIGETISTLIDDALSELKDTSVMLSIKRHIVDSVSELFVARESEWKSSVNSGLWGGIKIRGVFDDNQQGLDSAKERSIEIQKKDRHFNIFMGQIGKWMPFNPPPSMIETQEFAEKQLNDLMKSYLQEKIKADVAEKQRQQDMRDKDITNSLKSEPAASEPAASEPAASEPAA